MSVEPFRISASQVIQFLPKATLQNLAVKCVQSSVLLRYSPDASLRPLDHCKHENHTSGPLGGALENAGANVSGRFLCSAALLPAS